MPDVAVASRICRGVKYSRICTLRPLTFFHYPLPLSFPLFHRWRLRETPDIPLRLHPTFLLLPLTPSLALLTHRLWISSALFHPRRTYFNDSRHREARRMLYPLYNLWIYRGMLDRLFASIGISALLWQNEQPKGRKGWSGTTVESVCRLKGRLHWRSEKRILYKRMNIITFSLAYSSFNFGYFLDV